ncbi:GATA transcription factor 11 isoform X1 [Vigna radiata var. radiata]|uniref:GATA transcription factor 11 isoform X1 n=1 Tax=Vigna radiata var. radiata TaxID=3916 RepID=A0A3Q0EQU7_VIGRR|nr:GATA transcription factor 11 isoform X1 [Vigna radiata var. radiata]
MDMELFDFPLEDVETDDGAEEDWKAQFKFLEEPSLGIFPVQPSQLCAHTQNENVKVETSFSGSTAKTASPKYRKNVPIQKVSFTAKDLQQFQTNSPVSVFESSSSSSSPWVENSNLELAVIGRKRPRSIIREKMYN